MGIHSIRTAKNDIARPPETARDPARVIDEKTGGLAALLETHGRILPSASGRELIAEVPATASPTRQGVT
jgi:hypothetical protein